MLDKKNFHLESDSGVILATGVLYPQGNVQILWRIDIGYTAEQYSSLCLVLDLIL